MFAVDMQRLECVPYHSVFGSRKSV